MSGNGETFRIHPQNGRYFLHRGKPCVLITATEHYGAVLNRAFDQIAYLDESHTRHMTFTRLFLLFRELEHFGMNPHSPCKPIPAHYVAPFARTGAGFASDGYPRFNLDAWDDEFFARLHAFLGAAAERGIVVELTLFSNAYGKEIWRLNPFQHENNVNDVGHVEWQDYTSQRETGLFERQLAYVRKIVREVKQYDNIYFEVCNEPFGGFAGHATVAEVEAWESAIRATIKEVEGDLPRQHLIFQVPVECFRSDRTIDHLVDEPGIAAINIHDYQQLIYRDVPLPPISRFMLRDLHLGRIKHLWTTCAAANKPFVFDEDNAATNALDEQAWVIHRKRAWTTVLSGGHYNMIDFSIQVGGGERGSPAAQATIRTWIGHLSTFIHAIDFVSMQPAPDCCLPNDPALIATALGNDAGEYVVYIADAREIDEPDHGKLCDGTLAFNLPTGTYEAHTYSPVHGRYDDTLLAVSANGGLELPPIVEDVVVHLRRL